MGEYSSLYIGNHRITGWKNGAYDEVAILFTEDDFTDVPHPRWTDNWIYDEGDPRLKDAPCFLYQSTARMIIDRLDLLGYSLERAREAWDAGVQEAMRIGSEYDEQCGVEWERHYSELTFDVWAQLMRQVIEQGIEPIYLREHEQRGEALKKENPLLHYVLIHYVNSPTQFGFPSYDFDLVLRAMLSAVDPDAPVVLDCSPLVGWSETAHYVCRPPKAVVLTEGSSDQRIIERSLRYRYPHLHGYFAFPDFEATNLQGSTGQLVNLVKAFVATGVRRPTMVLFDNDAAGHDALRVLSSVPLPNEIRLAALPDLEMARYYPTTGPQGCHEVDINGCACGIELYLGQDILENATGHLAPVRFSSFIPGVGRWQGEITTKQAVQEQFRRFLNAAENDPACAQTHDWGGMDQILESIISLYKEMASHNLFEQDDVED